MVLKNLLKAWIPAFAGMTPSSSTSCHQGFTLLELIATLAIISLLITLSYPAYTQHVMKTRRVQAEVALLDLASGLERYHAVHHTYVGATLADAQMNQYTESDVYRLDILGATQNSYLLHAVPLSVQTQDACGVLSLNQLGERGVAGLGKIADCW